MGKVSKGVGCSVKGCEAKASASVSSGIASKYLTLSEGLGRRAYLCRDHYKELKKASKKDRSMERARYMF
ncbi:hypothetical protein HRbin01_00494 [archaeon HR01]|nr:hypothetical protein HRbin01_00494 [archaeon HR01]